jgi:hypothetical protein
MLLRHIAGGTVLSVALAAGFARAQTSGLTFSEDRKDDQSEDIPPPVPSEEAPSARRAPAAATGAEGAPAEAVPPPLEGAPEAEHPRGHYLGVKPGGIERPAVPSGPGMTPAVVTWPGFAMRPDGGSRFFLQLTAPVDVAHQTLPNKVVVDLQGARVAGTNNRYPLETRYFNTPVTRAVLKRNKGTTTLELFLRKAAKPRISSRAAPSGYHFLYVDFPSGDYIEEDVPTAPPAGETPAPPSAQGAPGAGARASQATYVPSDGEGSTTAGATGQLAADTSNDAELPPGMGKIKVKGQAKVGGGLRLER